MIDQTGDNSFEQKKAPEAGVEVNSKPGMKSTQTVRSQTGVQLNSNCDQAKTCAFSMDLLALAKFVPSALLNFLVIIIQKLCVVYVLTAGL